MRTFGYIVAGWLLLGFVLNGIFVAVAASGAGLFLAALGIAGMAWLIRSYRGGPRPEPASSDGRLRRLEAAFPEDPLASDDIVDAWGAHVHDADALERLRASYERTRRRLLAGDVEAAEEYLRSVSLLAGESPELEERAIEEHGHARRALEAAKDETTSEVLLAADARLQGARDALRKGEERPLDALRLATEAERLAALPRELAATEADVEQVRDAVAAAGARHPESALAELRGLPELAREEVERARALASAEDVGDALGAIDRARAHVRRVVQHLDRLEHAAAAARDRLHAAEAAADEATGPNRERASELIAHARRELEAAQPNWLEIVALAERALRLASDTDRELHTAGDDLDSARSRARDARDEALAWTLTGSRRAVEIQPLAEAADEAYREAERTTDAGLALSAFHRAEALALEALEKLAFEDGAAKHSWTGEFTFRWRGDLAG